MEQGYAAVVLAGGRGRRLGGAHKPALVVGGVALLDRVLSAVPDASPRVVVGPDQPVPAGVILRREEPAGGGPVAALAAGLAAVGPADWVAVLAADLPFLTAAVVRVLRTNATGDGAVLVDADGRAQYLAGVYRTATLRTALAAVGDPSGVAFRRVVAALDLVGVSSEASPPPWFDCDEPADVRRAIAWVDRDEPTKGSPVSTLDEWINVVGLELGIAAGPDGPVDRSLVLDLARDVAHGVARPAAPLTTYLLGVAVGAGADPRQAAASIVALAQGWDPDRTPDPAAEAVDTVVGEEGS